MSWTPPERAPWVAPLCALAPDPDAARRVVPLDEEPLLATAREATGLEDFGEPGFREGLRALLAALDGEAGLHLVGRLLARTEIGRTLESRLRLEAHLARHPEIPEAPIRGPIFVTGLARTGTSLLHELLALDPEHRAPPLYEMMFPVPEGAGAGEEGGRPDPRIARAHAQITLLERVVPAVRTMHELAAELPNECIYLFAYRFESDLYTGLYPIPSYAMRKARRDPRPAWREHRRLLAALQAGTAPRRFVLKAPSHLGQLRQLFETYPDAHVIVTHRDPLRVLGSLANLMATLHHAHSDRVRYPDIVRGLAVGHALLALRVMEARDAGELPANRIHDVRYRDLVADPAGTLEAIYRRMGRRLSPALREAIAGHLARRPGDRHGPHRYRFEDTGLDLEEERARYRAYQERYDVPSEVP